MKILAVAPWVPSPRRPRSFGLLRMLADDHEVRLIAACWDESDWQDLAQLPFETLGVPMRRTTALIRAASALPRRRSLQQAYLDEPGMRHAIQAADRRWQPDLAYFNTLRSAQWRTLITNGARPVIDLDEFRSNYYSQVARSRASVPSRMVALIEAAKMAAEEKRILREFATVIVSSPVDLGSSPKLTLVRSPDALSIDLRAMPARSVSRDIVFVGRMSYAANIQAVTWFVQSVMPRVWEVAPETNFTIVGDAPGAAIRELQSPRVEVTGRVDSVAEYYSSAAVSVIPVTEATGVQMKLIESLRLGVPTLSTPLVAQQAGVTNQEHVVTADSEGAWSEALLRLLGDTEYAESIGRAGQTWALRHYSPDAIRESLIESLTPARD